MKIWRYENLCSFTILAPKVVEDNVASTRSLLGLCSFKDGDFFNENLLKQHRKIQNGKVNCHIFCFHF